MNSTNYCSISLVPSSTTNNSLNNNKSSRSKLVGSGDRVVSPKSHSIVYGMNGGTPNKMNDLTSPTSLRKIKSPINQVNRIDLDILNQISFVTASFDGSIKVWEAA
jgi:hypothetical protein